MASGRLLQAVGFGAKPVSPPPLKASRKLSCLLIDDSKYDRQRLRRIASQTRLEIDFTETASLDASITALRTTEFDIILMDQTLPDGEGTTVAELFKTHLGADAPPIIMISGSLEAVMPVKARASGCASYISKDALNAATLEEAILDTIARTRSEPARTSVPIDEHKAALRSFADETAVELRSQLTVMLRLIASSTDRHPKAAADLNQIKAVCDEIWSYLDVLRRIETERTR